MCGRYGRRCGGLFANSRAGKGEDRFLSGKGKGDFRVYCSFCGVWFLCSWIDSLFPGKRNQRARRDFHSGIWWQRIMQLLLAIPDNCKAKPKGEGWKSRFNFAKPENGNRGRQERISSKGRGNYGGI